MKRLSYLIIILLAVLSCKKENDKTQWDIEVVGPLFHATLTMSNFLGDKSIVTTSDNAQILAYDSTFSNFNLDTLSELPDTTITTVTRFPFNQLFQPGSQFPSNNNETQLGFGNVGLTEAFIKSGSIQIEIKNTLHSKIIFEYKIPGATLNGVPFFVTAEVDSASFTNPKYFSHTYDLTGYHFNLTGTTGTSFNTISYDIKTISDPNGHPFNVNANDTVVNLKANLLSVVPLFVRGYLGQSSQSTVNNLDFGIGDLVDGGTVELDSIRLNLDLTNYIGADEQIYISLMRSVNTRTNTIVNLVAPNFLNHYLNINRARLYPALTDSLVPFNYSIQLDQTNSNIQDLIENLPEKFDYDLNLSLNPQGNISGNNDFLFTDRLVTSRLRLTMPLRFALNQLMMVDTIPFTLEGGTNYDPVGTTNLKLIASNSFPFDINLQMLLLDSTQAIVDSMFVPDLIRAAPYDINYRSTGKTRTVIEVPVDINRKGRLLSVKRIIVRTKFNTPDYPQLIQMYSDYRLDLKLVADGIYSIR